MTTSKGPRSATPPKFFATPAAFRSWLATHHRTAAELLVGFHKKDTGTPSITWPESVDQALCFGWIDGIRRRIDDERYTIRFTPRKAVSVWSAVNIRRVAELTAQGLMEPAGIEAFARRSGKKSQIYSYEQRHAASFDTAQLAQLKRHPNAWAFFQAQPPGYRQKVTYWVATAKSPDTRQRRLDKLIAESENGRRL